MVLERAGAPEQTLPVVHASERPGCGLPAPAGPAPALQYELRLPGGACLRAALYLVYSQPLPAGASRDAAAAPQDAAPGASGADPQSGEPARDGPQHAWLGVSRAHCCRGCDAALPLLAGIQRLARPGRGAAAPAPTKRTARAAAGVAAAVPAAAPEPADGGAAGGAAGRVKDARHLYVSLDEPSAHVAPGPGGTRHFRLLLAVWRGGTGPAGPLLGCCVSRPIRVVANNDVPGGAAALLLRVPLRGAASGAAMLAAASWTRQPDRVARRQR